MHTFHGFNLNTSHLRLFILTLVPIVDTLVSIIIALPTLPLANALNLDVVKLSTLTVLKTVLDALNTKLERSSKGGSVCDIHVRRSYIDIVVVIIVDCQCVLMLESRVMLVNGSNPPFDAKVQ